MKGVRNVKVFLSVGYCRMFINVQHVIWLLLEDITDIQANGKGREIECCGIIQ